MDLGEKQELFSELFAKLVLFAISRGYKVRIGEVERPEEMAKLYAAAGKGISNSLHILKLAGDLLLFKNGDLLEKSEEYQELGDFWKAQHPLCCWGGDFKSRADGDHFSITHEGVK